MSKIILFDSEARKSILSGVNQVANVVASTMGANGKNVLISYNQTQPPSSTRDGISAAKSISLKDPVENAAALLTRSVAEKTVEIAGDATTCSIVLFREMVQLALKNIEAGANSVELKMGIEKAVIKVVEVLKSQSKSIGESNDLIKNIATIAANNDEEIGGLIADAFAKIGNDGILLIEESKSTKTEIRIDDGYQFDRGYSSPYWVTNKEKMICELKSPFVLIVDGKIDKWNDMRLILEEMVKMGKKDILIIADSVDGEAMDALMTNKLMGIFNPVVINAPSYGERRKQMMEDIAILTDGHYVSQDYNLVLPDARIINCGTCEKAVITKDTTTLVNGDGEKERIDERVAQIGSLIEQSESDIEKELLKQRIGKLTGSIAVFSVGGATEIEMKEKKDRVDDAIRSTKCAIEEGIIPGGGTALIRCISSLSEIQTNSIDEKTGVDIIRKSIEAPLRQIATNAGKTGELYVEKVKEAKGNFGYNVKTDKIEDLVEVGIIDAVKVIRVALENAASVACMVIISECLVVEVG